MWFWFSVAALLCWSGSDLFSKIGCRSPEDAYSHLKMVTAVGTVMGLHALYEILIQNVSITAEVFFTYLPVSALYILSMTIGYLGLKFIELSISSPVCNSSGAIVAVLTIAVYGLEKKSGFALIAIAMVCIGVIGLGIVEAAEDEELRRMRQDPSNYYYAKSVLAILIPIIYCLLDALGTFADSRVLEILEEDSANVAYELTFFAAGIICAVYVYGIKGQRAVISAELPKAAGAVFETVGQFFYIYALADTAHVVYSAPIISSYCVVSVLWGRIFLKEKLSKRHYACVLFVIVGIVILGSLDI